MISDKTSQIPNVNLEYWEKPLKEFNTSLYKLLASNYDLQQRDSQLYPGRMDDMELRNIIPYVIWTSEFDFYRRDCIDFAKRGRSFGKLLDISDMPGVYHGY